MNIKSERVKLHFAETTKKMIVEDGVEGVSIRKVANKAGYSFATIYNHFNNLDQLLWYTRELMILDIFEYMNQTGPQQVSDVPAVKQIFHNYMDYFMKYPNVYRFFYFHQLSKADKPASINQNEINEKHLETFNFLIQSGKFSENEVMVVIKTLIYTSQGLLTMLLSDNDDIKPEGAYQDLEALIDFLLKDLNKT